MLTVKELAWELGVSEHFIYLMRANGFPMAWRQLPEFGRRPVLTATIRAAREWREANEFRLVHGLPVLTPGQLHFGLQLDFVTAARAVVKGWQSQMAGKF